MNKLWWKELDGKKVDGLYDIFVDGTQAMFEVQTPEGPLLVATTISNEDVFIDVQAPGESPKGDYGIELDEPSVAAYLKAMSHFVESTILGVK